MTDGGDREHLDGGTDKFDASNGDDASSHPPDAAHALDAAVPLDAAPSIHPMTEVGNVSCWSVGGFQAVYHDQPAHIVVNLYDGDGIADIETTANVTILGHYNAPYQVGPRPLLPLGTTGCCQTTVKVPIYYDDFIAAAHTVGGPDGTFWSAYATFRDHGGTTIVARCDDEWFLHDGNYGP